MSCHKLNLLLTLFSSFLNVEICRDSLLSFFLDEEKVSVLESLLPKLPVLRAFREELGKTACVEVYTSSLALCKGKTSSAWRRSSSNLLTLIKVDVFTNIKLVVLHYNVNFSSEIVRKVTASIFQEPIKHSFQGYFTINVSPSTRLTLEEVIEKFESKLWLRPYHEDVIVHALCDYVRNYCRSVFLKVLRHVDLAKMLFD